MPNISLRPAARSPAQENERTLPAYTNANTRKFITFKHPAYSDNYQQSSLLQLYAWDTQDGGLHAGTALLACAIVACNAQDGYLTRHRDGDSLHVGDDELLLDDEYYYHVPNPVPATQESSGRAYYRYPVYPTFEHWAFPHGNISSRWLRGVEGGEGEDMIEPSSTPSVSSVSAAVIARDRACAISKHRDYIERAHLCPRNELDWFREDGMRKYNARRDISGDLSTDDMANAIALRPDLHRAFDDCRFAIARKNGQWVAHFLETTYELGSMYHNRPVEIAASVSAEFLLARFAWAIFPLVKAFMEQGPERLVKLRQRSSDGFYEVTKTLDPATFAQLGSTGSARSKSPKKRKASESNLPPVVEVKRQRLSTDDSDKYKEASSLSSYEGTISEEESGEDTMATIRKHELRKRRPTHDPSLICCDYSLAEHENALGHPGKPEYGGGHLCMKCLGSEDPW